MASHLQAQATFGSQLSAWPLRKIFTQSQDLPIMPTSGSLPTTSWCAGRMLPILLKSVRLRLDTFCLLISDTGWPPYGLQRPAYVSGPECASERRPSHLPFRPQPHLKPEICCVTHHSQPLHLLPAASLDRRSPCDLFDLRIL